MITTIRGFLNTELGINEITQHKIFISFIILILISVIRLVILRIVWKQTQNVKIRYNWKRTLSLTLSLVATIFIGAVWLPAFEQFGAFLGLFTAGLAIALKDPLTNLAGWFFIVFRKPFAVGDRIQIGNFAGDVIDIRLFQFSILEIGNWVEADQSTGRIVHMPNGKVFLESQANYTSGFEYIWHEIPVLVTFESNWKKTKTILHEIVTKYAEHLSATAGKEIFEASKNYMIYYKNLNPIVYTKVKDSGVMFTMRYLCNPRKRRGSENDIWEEILTRFSEHNDIKLAYPTTRFYKMGEENQIIK
jgi:small-conductance mechanosensitive channel